MRNNIKSESMILKCPIDTKTKERMIILLKHVTVNFQEKK